MKIFTSTVIATLLTLTNSLSAQTQSVYLAPYTSSVSIGIDLSIPIEVISKEIQQTFQTQNININQSLNILPADAARTTMFSRVNEDFGILYTVSTQVSQNNFSRLINMQAQGELYDVKSRRFLTSFRVPAPDTIVVALSDAQCGISCVNNAIASGSEHLAREVGFVLSQKLHFIRQDEGSSDNTDVNSIRGRLLLDHAQPPLFERIDSVNGAYTIDRNRSVDIEVYFGFDSAELTEEAKSQISPLGEALAQSDLRDQRYLILGHTDAKGTAEYNRVLSQRRAESVRNFIVQNYPVNPSNLIAIGQGEDVLKSPTDPYGAINRRVEVSVIATQPNSEFSVNSFQGYTLTFNLLPSLSVINLMRDLERQQDYKFELIQSNQTQRVYSLQTVDGLYRLETRLLSALESVGIDRRNVRLATSGQSITIEALN